MRIMAMGTKFITRRLILTLAGTEFELFCPSDVFEVVTLLKAVLRRFWPANELKNELYAKAPEILAEFSY